MTQISHDAGQQREPARTVLAGQMAYRAEPHLSSPCLTSDFEVVKGV